MYRLWLEGKATMTELDGPPDGLRLSLADVMLMVEALDEWADAARRLADRRRRGED